MYVTEKSSFIESWRWAQPNVNTYATLVRGLAASLRVADAIEVVADVRRRGVPAGDEVPRLICKKNTYKLPDRE